MALIIKTMTMTATMTTATFNFSAADRGFAGSSSSQAF
jgi:hypothetical protein